MRLTVRNRVLFIDDTFSMLYALEPLPGEVWTPFARAWVEENRNRKLRRRIELAVAIAFPTLDPELQRELGQQAEKKALHALRQRVTGVGSGAANTTTSAATSLLPNVGGGLADAALSVRAPDVVLGPPSVKLFNSAIAGINFPEMYTPGSPARSKFIDGSPAIFTDCKTLGVTAIRQLGSTDFNWKQLVELGNPGVSNPSLAIRLDPWDNFTDLTPIVDRYVDVFTRANAAKVKLVCTLFLTPEGEDVTNSLLPHYKTADSNPIGFTTQKYLKNPSGNTIVLDYSQVESLTGLEWHPEHINLNPPYLAQHRDVYGVTLSNNLGASGEKLRQGYKFPQGAASAYTSSKHPLSIGPDYTISSSDPNAIHLVTMDPFCKYKQIFLGRIAEAIVEILRLVQHRVSFSIADTILAFEVANELSSKFNVVNNAVATVVGTTTTYKMTTYECLKATGRFWGQAHFWAAYGLRKAMKDLGWNVPIWGAGILGYNNAAAAGGPFDYNNRIIGFTKGFLHGIADEILDIRTNDRTVLEDIFGAIDEATMSQFISGIDYHWYHRYNPTATSPSADYLQTAYLVHELEELRALPSVISLADTDDDDEKATLIRALTWTVSNFENGSGLADLGYQHNTNISLPIQTSINTGNVITRLKGLASTQEPLQAIDLWRRLGGAWVGGAYAAGWHTSLAKPNSADINFTHGLRFDLQDVSVSPQYSYQRLSWFAFQRLIQLIGTTFSTAQLIYPPSSSRSNLVTQLSAAPTGSPLLWLSVYRFETTNDNIYMFITQPQPSTSSTVYTASITIDYAGFLISGDVETSPLTVSLSSSSGSDYPFQTAMLVSPAVPLATFAPIRVAFPSRAIQEFTMNSTDQPILIKMPKTQTVNSITVS